MSRSDDAWRENVAQLASLELLSCLENGRLPDDELIASMWHAHGSAPRQDDSIQKRLQMAWLYLAAIRTSLYQEITQEVLQRALGLTISPVDIVPEELRNHLEVIRTEFSDEEIREIRDIKETAEWIWADIGGPLGRAGKTASQLPEVDEIMEIPRATHFMLKKLSRHIDATFRGVLEFESKSEPYEVSSNFSKTAIGSEYFLRPLLRKLLSDQEVFLYACGATWHDKASQNGLGSYQGYLILTTLGVRFCYNPMPHDVAWDTPYDFFIPTEWFGRFEPTPFYASTGSMTLAVNKGVKIALQPSAPNSLAEFHGQSFITNHHFDSNDTLKILSRFEPSRNYAKHRRRFWSY